MRAVDLADPDDTAAEVPTRPTGRSEPDEASAARASADVVHRQAALVSATTLVVSIANYAFSLVLIRLLAVPAYVEYASVQSLLLVLGSGGMAAIPWAVARHVALDRDARAAGEALGFGLIASVGQGVVFGGLCFAFIGSASDVRLGLTTGAAAFALSVIAAPLGVLQGQGRLVTISLLRLVETAVRIALSVLLVVTVAADPESPVVGFIAGSVVLAGLALAACRGSFPLRRAARATYRGLLRHSALLGAAQLALAALGTVDTVVVAMTSMDSPAAHDYQVAALLGRVPLFLGSAIAMTYFPQVASATSEVVARLHQARAVRLMFVLGIPIAALLATTPNWALEILAPGRGAHVAHLLPLTGITGTTVAMATVLACAHQADQRYGRLLLRLVPLVVMEPLVLIIAGDLGTSTTFALCAAATGVVTVGVLVADIRSWRPWAVLRRSDVGGVLIVVTLAVVGGAVPLVWWIALVATLTVFARALLGGSAERHDLDVHDRGAR